MLKAIFFDAAGTLIHLPRSVGEHYREVAKSFGADLAAEALERAFRRAWSETLPRAAGPGPRPDDDKGWWRDLVSRVLSATPGVPAQPAFDQDAYFEALYAHFARPGVWALLPDVAELLEELRDRGLRLAVVSNFDLRLEAILTDLGVRSCFDHVILSSQVGADKPDPQIFRHALDALEVTAAEVVHIGDDRKRDGGAEALGIRVFHLDPPAHTLRGVLPWLDVLDRA